MPTSLFDAGAGWSGVGKRLFSGEAAYTKGMNDAGRSLSQQNANNAHAALFSEQADALRQRRQYQTPEFSNQIAASLAGLSDQQGSELSAFKDRGNWGSTVETLPPEISGPPMTRENAAPKWYSPEVDKRFNTGRAAFMANLAGTGDSNASNIAEAFAKLSGQGRIDDVVSGRTDPAMLGKAMAASGGKPLFHQGSNGVMDQFTGTEMLNAVGKSAATENLAQAGNASASAALHKAQIPEVQSRIDLNKSKIGAPIILTDKDGNQTVYDPKAKGQGKPPTEFQAKSATYGARAKEAHDAINELEALAGADAYSRIAATSLGGNGVLNTLANPALSSSTQKAIQAQRDFMNAVLRQESGAVIGPSEFANGVRQYFQQPGDKPEVIEQKRRNRETAIKGFDNSAGPAKFEAPPLRQVGVSVALSGVPASAIAHVKANPNLINAFAAKYGKEAADAVTGRGK